MIQLLTLDGSQPGPLLGKGGWNTENGALRLDGACAVRHKLPQLCAEAQIKLKLEFGSDPIDGCSIQIGPYYFGLGIVGNSYSLIQRLGGGDLRLMADRMGRRFVPGRVHEVEARAEADGTLALDLDGQVVLRKRNPRSLGSFTTWGISLNGPVRVHALHVSGTPAAEMYRCRPPAKSFLYSVAIDFPDDIELGPEPWTEESLRALSDRYAQMGVRRVFYNDHGGRAGGLYDAGGNDHVASPKVQQTFANMPDTFETLSRLCHERDIECFGILKLFDMGQGARQLCLPSNPPPRMENPLPVLGGYAGNALRFIRDNPELLSQRHPAGRFGAMSDAPVAAIRFYALDDAPAPLPLKDLAVWESDANCVYRPVTGFRVREEVVNRAAPAYAPLPEVRTLPERPVRCVIIEGLAIRAPFLAVTLPPRKTSPAPRFVNQLAALAELLDAAGNRLEFCVGLTPRDANRGDDDFRKAGMFFEDRRLVGNWSHGTAESVYRHAGALDNPRGVIAFARGHSRYIPGALDLSEPRVHEFWLDLASRLMNRGADGIDLRIQNHQKVNEAEDYGFNPPAVAEFRRRTGVDATREPFDRAAWRRLRGEYHVELLRELRKMTADRGCKLLHHISPAMEWEPEEGTTFTETHWDWRRWLKENLVDGITYKNRESNTAFLETVIDAVHAAGLPIYDSPYLASQPPETWAALEREIIDRGFDGWTIYENATIFRLDAGGKSVSAQPGLADIAGLKGKS